MVRSISTVVLALAAALGISMALADEDGRRGAYRGEGRGHDYRMMMPEDCYDRMGMHMRLDGRGIYMFDGWDDDDEHWEDSMRRRGYLDDDNRPRDPRRSRRSRMIGPIDTNDDGAVSLEEAASRAEAMFLRQDRNRDDTLSGDEIRGPRTGAMDADDDGQISHEEFMTAHQERYAEADRNGDGTIDPFEFRMRR